MHAREQGQPLPHDVRNWQRVVVSGDGSPAQKWIEIDAIVRTMPKDGAPEDPAWGEAVRDIVERRGDQILTQVLALALDSRRGSGFVARALRDHAKVPVASIFRAVAAPSIPLESVAHAGRALGLPVERVETALAARGAGERTIRRALEAAGYRPRRLSADARAALRAMGLDDALPSSTSPARTPTRAPKRVPKVLPSAGPPQVVNHDQRDLLMGLKRLNGSGFDPYNAK